MSTDRSPAAKAERKEQRRKLAQEHDGREFSAGGVVVRDDEVVVIVPTRRGPDGERVLALPKGHPELGESALAGAIREVREEAGVSGELIESLGEYDYSYKRGGKQHPKRVEFFLFEYRDGDVADHDGEVEEASWMKLTQAAEQLTFVGEREVVKRAISRRSRDL